MHKGTFYLFALASLLSPLTTARAELPPDLRLEADSAIDLHRKGTLIIQTTPGARVSVEQTRHDFWFGAALANNVFGGRMQAETREKYLSVFLENFNAAVTDNALKWHCMEPTRGQVNYSTVNATLEWCDRHQVPLRGHNIFWGVPNMVPDWQKELSDDELRQVVRDRALDIGTRYRGRFAEYDLNNEMIHGNYYDYRLGTNITLEMARWVREADPKAVLFLNDYDVLTGKRLDDYAKHIQGLLDQGVPIGGIGAQGHVHDESFDPVVLRDSLQTLAQFGLPIRITEFNMPGQRSRFYENTRLRLTDAEEESKAKAIVDYYRLCFAQPRVEGILMWGFWEGANWIPASSLYKRDWTPLPAASAYKDLVFNQWWTRVQGQADAQGRYEIRAFYGEYRVTVEGKEVVVNLSKAEGRKTVFVK